MCGRRRSSYCAERRRSVEIRVMRYQYKSRTLQKVLPKKEKPNNVPRSMSTSIQCGAHNRGYHEKMQANDLAPCADDEMCCA